MCSYCADEFPLFTRVSYFILISFSKFHIDRTNDDHTNVAAQITKNRVITFLINFDMAVCRVMLKGVFFLAPRIGNTVAISTAIFSDVINNLYSSLPHLTPQRLMMTGDRYSCLVQNVQDGSGMHPVSSSVCKRGLTP
jgi:hypothetical protein